MHDAAANFDIADAVVRLRAGELVGFPTETVYGLGADATNAAAVAKIFEMKGRPATNPLIAHVADVATARRYAADWPEAAGRLAAAFWPGPLTIVVRRTSEVADAVAAGGTTVGLRVPAHPVALGLLRAFGGAVAGPSANRSNHVSPTTAAHVREEFGDRVPVLDGGPCGVGIESTVVDVTGDRPAVLRPGAIAAEDLARVVGPLRDTVQSSAALRSPGQMPVHYAPRTPAFRFETHERLALDLSNAVVLEPTLDPATYARNLYARFRMLDTQGLNAIYVEMPPDQPRWHAIRDRLLRATRALP